MIMEALGAVACAGRGDGPPEMICMSVPVT